MKNKVARFLNRKDWRGYNLARKAWIIPLFVVKPMYAWHHYPEDFYHAFEIDYNALCKSRELMNLLYTLKYDNQDVRVLLTLREMFNVYNLARKTLNLEGDMAEVGVFQGGSALIISHTKGNKCLHLFDTFEGLPEPDKNLDCRMVKGDMHNTSTDLVRKNLNGYPNVLIYKGLFPETASEIENKKFCFVHNDTDIYSSSKAFLEFFYPRMVKGGIILTHDYNDTRTPGVKKAFDEFFTGHRESINEIWDTQAYVVKM